MTQADRKICCVLYCKNKYCENYYTILHKAMLRCNTIPIKLLTAFFTELKQTKKNTVCMETLKNLNSQSNLEKEKWSWRNQAP